ncbi:MAG: hypothetical protein ACRDSL_20765 [Pseudonocardiaceae bacterium]
MDLFSAATESGVESALIDLGPVPLKVLRVLDDAVLHRALRHVVEQIGYVRVTEDHSGARID